jgi:hypothetical protein
MIPGFDAEWIELNTVVIGGHKIKNELTWEQWSKLPREKREEIREFLEPMDSLSTEQAKILFIPTTEDEAGLIKEVGNDIRKMLDDH